MARLFPLPYLSDPCAAFGRIRDMPWAMWLDSGWPQSTAGRHDIMVAEPSATLYVERGLVHLRSGGAVRRFSGDPFSTLQEMLAHRRSASSDSGWPFQGGAVGYFAYDLARQSAGLSPASTEPPGLPEMAVGFYDWALVTDHHARRTVLVGKGAKPGVARRLLARLHSTPRTPAFNLTSEIAVDPCTQGYGAVFERIRRYLLEGDCYQVNFARRWRTSYSGDPWGAYLMLRRRSAVPFAGYLNLPFGTVLSLSPERFLNVEGDIIRTWPIKGTRPRGDCDSEDERHKRELAESAKDRAENLMIVDLMRNDLGRVCRTGSVRVTRLFEPESFATVHHLVSGVEGRLLPGVDAIEAFRTCFPGGSITGAPKRRAMQIIDELEVAPRGIYCGSIGYVGDDGFMDTNIAIRTAVCRGGRMYYWAGGAVVADSRAMDEYDETVAKAAPFLGLGCALAR